MAIIEKRRTLRPSTRDPKSTYRIKLGKLQSSDIVRISIDHESESFKQIYEIAYSELGGKTDLHFVAEKDVDWSIRWRGDAIPRLIKG